MPSKETTPFKQSELAAVKRQLERLAGRVGAVIESMKDVDPPADQLEIEYGKSLTLALKNVGKFVGAAADAFGEYELDNAKHATLNGHAAEASQGKKKPGRK